MLHESFGFPLRLSLHEFFRQCFVLELMLYQMHLQKFLIEKLKHGLLQTQQILSRFRE